MKQKNVYKGFPELYKEIISPSYGELYQQIKDDTPTLTDYEIATKVFNLVAARKKLCKSQIRELLHKFTNKLQTTYGPNGKHGDVLAKHIVEHIMKHETYIKRAYDFESIEYYYIQQLPLIKKLIKIGIVEK